MVGLVEKKKKNEEAGVQPEQRGSELQKPSPAGGTTRSRSVLAKGRFATLVCLVPLSIRVLPNGRVKRIPASPLSSPCLALRIKLYQWRFQAAGSRSARPCLESRVRIV